MNFGGFQSSGLRHQRQNARKDGDHAHNPPSDDRDIGKKSVSIPTLGAKSGINGEHRSHQNETQSEGFPQNSAAEEMSF